MANSAVGAIDIISRQNGALISEVAGNQSVVALNGLSIVRIHGTADSVASYERQGNDLILHMKDGTTVRYQHFFTADAEGNYSELVFDDGVNPPVHVTFPTAVGAAAGAGRKCQLGRAIGGCIRLSGDCRRYWHCRITQQQWQFWQR
ncbi:BapA prefix-like domain-containing protein [Yersinia enterocolitica]